MARVEIAIYLLRQGQPEKAELELESVERWLDGSILEASTEP
jgi:hypothetical protein